MRQNGLDCLVATSHDNVYYCSGADIITISMLKRLAAVFLPVDGEPCFGVHGNEQVTARGSTWIKDLRVYEGGEWEPLRPIKFVAEVLKEKGLRSAKVGVELLDVPGLCLDYLRELLPAVKFVDCQPLLEKMRSVKSPEELELLSHTNMATAKAITAAFEIASVGDTEREIARNMMDLTCQYGADSVAFMTFGAGQNIFETHHIPGDYRIKVGDLLHVDFGCFFKGYLSDISRTAVAVKPDENQLRSYRIAVEAEDAAAKAMREGATVMDVHNATKRFYESQGLGYRRAFIGHGLGIGCHEAPFLGPSHGNWELKEGMFFQVEPSSAIGQARVHTEDSYIISKEGAKNVSEYRDIHEMQIVK